MANKASKDHTHDASKVTGTFLDKTFRWLLGDGNSSSDYAELRKSGASPDFGLSFVFHDTSANTNTFYGVFDKSGKFQLATKDSVDKLSNKASSLESTVSELDGAACKAYHWTNGNESSAPYYKSLNIKYSGGTFGTNPFWVDVGNIYIICAPQPGSTYKTCSWKEIVTGNDAINPSKVECIKDGSLSRIKITFASTINPGCNIVPLCPETAVAQVYTATS